MDSSEDTKKHIKIYINMYPNHDIYKIISDDEATIEEERNYFIEKLGGDNIGNNVIIVSPIVRELNLYTFMVTSTIKGIINTYRRRINNYQVNGYMDYITREGLF